MGRTRRHNDEHNFVELKAKRGSAKRKRNKAKASDCKAELQNFISLRSQRRESNNP